MYNYSDSYQCTTDMLDIIWYFTTSFFQLMVCIGVFVTGVGCSTLVVAHFIVPDIAKTYYKKLKLEEDDDEVFDCKYINEYLNLDKRELTDNDFKELEEKYIFEYTPRGLVVMSYSKDKEAFTYYCDTKNLSYTYLEVVARGFVCQFNCSNLLINTRDEFIESVRTLQAKKLEDKIKESEDLDDSSVFATLKKSAPVSHSKPVETIDTNLRLKASELPIMEKGNKYIYIGSVQTYLDRFKDEAIEDNSFMNIDYNTFKSIGANKKNT